MSKNKVIMAILAGIVITIAIIAWLFFGGSAPKEMDIGDGVKAKLNASLKNTELHREKDGATLWSFTIGELVNDKFTDTAILKGVKGKVYRSDGSYIDVVADQGALKVKTNDFALEGNVKAIISTGEGKLFADKVEWFQKNEQIVATGNVKLYRNEWFASADQAITTSAFKKLTLKGNAEVEKGGDVK